MEWSARTLEETLLALRERGFDSTEIEVKSAHQGMPQNLGQTLSAFANMPDGGTLILGVDEKRNFSIVGVAPEVEAGVASLAREHVHPSPHLDFHSFTFNSDDKTQPCTVLLVAVKGLNVLDRPAFYKGQAYLRQSDGDYPMNDSERRMIEVAKLHAEEQIFYDQAAIPNSSIDDLDAQYLKVYLSNARSNSKRLAKYSNDKDVLRVKGLLTAEGQVTLAGLYALGKYPQGFCPALTVTAAVRLSGVEGARTRNRRDFDGPLPDLLEDIMDWCAENIPIEQVYQPDGHMIDRPVLPMRAVREFIANALIHRDLGPSTLGEGKSIQIRLDSSKGLFIESPGGLRGLSVAQLESMEHTQAAVNQRLYDAAKYLRTSEGDRLIEGEGGGIQEGFSAMAQAGLRLPQLINSGVKFKVILWLSQLKHGQLVGQQGTSFSPPPFRTNVPSRNSYPTQVDSSSPKLRKNSPLILTTLSHEGTLSATELAQKLNLTLAQVRYALRPLLDSGAVIREGGQGSHSTVYRAA
ncbi:RNA-binding domain-containing protein [Rothia nasimurium]|uniref:RNA-binding domain-containing protein n=1 Tax=Rothia nasimurium TaxID=85336 RepID=UPI003B9F478F